MSTFLARLQKAYDETKHPRDKATGRYASKGSTPEARVKAMHQETVTVELSPSVELMLAMDEPSISEGTYKVTGGGMKNKSTLRLELKAEGALTMLGDLMDRSDPGAGWDQPLWYLNAAKANATKLRAQLDRHFAGRAVIHTGHFYVPRLVPL